MNDLLAQVSHHPFLEGMVAEHSRILAEHAMPVSFAAGETIFKEGEPANRFYLIQEGHVLLSADRGRESRVPVQTIGSGEVLGWSWLFPPYYWHFTASAVDPVKAMFFYGTRLRERCDVDTDLGYDLMKRVAKVVIDRLQRSRLKFLAENG